MDAIASSDKIFNGGNQNSKTLEPVRDSNIGFSGSPQTPVWS